MKIFISYRRADNPQVAGRIFDKLVDFYGADNVFKDVDSIPLGSDFRKKLEELLVACDVLLVVVGRQWLNAIDDLGQKRLEDASDFVRLELETALSGHIPIIPLLVDGAMMPSAEGLPTSLQEFAFRNA